MCKIKTKIDKRQRTRERQWKVKFQPPRKASTPTLENVLISPKILNPL